MRPEIYLIQRSVPVMIIVMRILFILIMSSALVMNFPHSLYADNITIVYTNSLNGHFDDCHCKEEPKGGLVARATEIKKIRSELKNVFLFETGDFFTCEPDTLLAKYLIQGYKYINYDALTFGDQEVGTGIDEFHKYSRELLFVSDNILFEMNGKWENKFDRYRIITKDNMKIGVIGTISKESFKYFPKSITEKIRITDQVQEISKDIETLKKNGASLIVLLSHSGFEEDKILAQKIKGIDVIVGGHSQTWLKMPEKTGSTIIVQAGANGARIGILELSAEKGNVKIIKNSFRLPYLPSTEEDKEIRKMINSYQEEVKKEYKNLRFK